MPSAAYTAWVHRVWDRLHQRTGHSVHYMARNRVACYCPSCGVGTLHITFRDDPPRAIVSSQTYPGHCSEGCTEAEVMEALA